jgi:enoyl-[acyl-carrier protein] reductase I
MGLLEGKTALIFGIANDHSLAWGIAEAFHREGAQLGFSHAGAALEKRVRPLAESIGVDWLEECDVSSDEAIEAVFERARERFGTIDILVHSIAFAPREDLTGRFVNTTRKGFAIAHDISAYSLLAMTRAAMPLMPGGGTVIGLTYYGGEKVVPKYRVMGVAKAALDATVRYLAQDLGPEKIRVNAISVGPVRTLAASGVGGFRGFLKLFAEMAPLRTNVTKEDVGNAAVYLCSDLARVVTGEVLHVDSGYNILGMPDVEDIAAP